MKTRMKRSLLLLAAVALSAAACSKKSGGGVRLRSDTDSVAYVIGLNVAHNLMRMDSTINVDAVCEGIRDVFRQSPRLAAADAETFFLRYMNYTLPEKAREYEEQFLADIAKSNRSYARTPSGVTYTVDEVGDQGQIPVSDRDTVSVRYRLRTADGTERFSSYERGDTLRTALGDLPKGVKESLRLVGRGGRIVAWLPAAMAYGAEGNAELGIGANATLCYELELVDLEKISGRNRR